MLSWYCFCIFSAIVTLVSAFEDYKVVLSSNGPIVLGGTITFQADLYTSDNDRPNGDFQYIWEDDSLKPHKYQVSTTNTTTFFSVQYSAESSTIGLNKIQVEVYKYEWIVYRYLTSARLDFQITEYLHGNISMAQLNKTIESKYMSSTTPTNLTINIFEADRDFALNKSHIISTFWFIDCKYYGQSTDLSFNYNFTKPNSSHIIESLVVISKKLPPPNITTTSTTMTTTIAPTTTSLPASNATHIVTSTPSTTIRSTTLTSITEKSLLPANMTVKTPISIIGNKNIPAQLAGIIDITDMTVMAIGNKTEDDGCLNTSIIIPDPEKTYGYFRRYIEVKAPISNISVEGTNWIQPWDMLSLNVTCNGSGPFLKCLQFERGKYNVTGNETCDGTETLEECKFTITRYFLEPSVYTVLVILKNDIGKTIKQLTINIYKVEKKPQLSVIVVPVSCSLVAVVLIVFGVAYYIQNRARFTVEVADFDFGKHNPDMEYKSFVERLRDSFNNTIRPGGDGISGYKPLRNAENIQRQK